VDWIQFTQDNVQMLANLYQINTITIKHFCT